MRHKPDLTPTERLVLYALRPTTSSAADPGGNWGPMAYSEIAKEMGGSMCTVERATQSLVRKGLVHRIEEHNMAYFIRVMTADEMARYSDGKRGTPLERMIKVALRYTALPLDDPRHEGPKAPKELAAIVDEPVEKVLETCKGLKCPGEGAGKGVAETYLDNEPCYLLAPPYIVPPEPSLTEMRRMYLEAVGQ